MLEEEIYDVNMKRNERETQYRDFVKIVKEKNIVFASLSRSQTYPNNIHYAAILRWQWDGEELFATTINGERVVANTSMPAFHIYS